MHARISKVERNIVYFRDQIIGWNQEFQHLISIKNQISPAQFEQMQNEIQSGMADSNSNLSSERRMLSYLQNKLNSNDFDLSVGSSTGKRKFGD